MKNKLLIILIAVISGIFVYGNSTEVSLNNEQCTKENVYIALKQLNIKHTDIVFAQILLESGHLKSRLVETNNNIIGMKHPRKRETTSLGSKKGYAVYDNWYSCLVDYGLYQQNIMKNKNMTRSQYMAYISKKYSENNAYKIRIKNIIKQNNNFIQKQDSIYETTHELTNNRS
jgi:hypothetical protein